MRDTVVIGAGLAGLSAALRLAQAGQKVTLINKGIGGLQLGQGTIDVLGYTPELVENPIAAVDKIELSETNEPSHPYAYFSSSEVKESLEWIKSAVGPELLVGGGENNFRLPTAVGALRPTALAAPSMLAGQPTAGKRYVIVGLQRLKDFYPELVAANLARQVDNNGNLIDARAISVDIEIRPGEMDTSGLNFARGLDNAEMRKKLCDVVRPLLQPGEVVGFPAVLGIRDLTAWTSIAEELGHEVFEIPLPPPSVPGMRLNDCLLQLVKKQARVINGVGVVDFLVEEGKIQSVQTTSAGHPLKIEASNFVLATGGFESGALNMDSHGTISENVFGLPLQGITDEPLHADYWGKDQPLFKVGVPVNRDMQPLTVGNEGKPGSLVYPNLYAAGGILAGAIRWREKSGDAIALVTASRAAESILGSEK